MSSKLEDSMGLVLSRWASILPPSLKTGKEYEEAGSLPAAERVVCETYELKNHGAKKSARQTMG